MKKFIILLIIFSTTNISAQNITESTETLYEEIFHNNNRLTDEPCDTLIIENGDIYYFARSPIQQFKGYTALFKHNKEVMVYFVPISLGAKGYRLTWIIKNKKLYISNISWVRHEYHERTKKGEFKLRKGKFVSYKKVKKRLEKLTGKKFDKEGLLWADWVTDTARVLKYQPFVKFSLPRKTYYKEKIFLENNQTEYIMEIKKGEIIRFDKNENIKNIHKPYSEDYLKNKLDF